MTKRLSWFIILVLVLGYIFLYGPIVSLVVYSLDRKSVV